MPKRLFVAIKGRSLQAILSLFFVALVAFLFLGPPGKEKIIPEQLLAQSIQKTMDSKSFHYQVQVGSGAQDALSQVEGLWVSPNRMHIKGKMYNTPVEIIQVEDMIYMKDIWTGKWLALKNSKLNDTQLFVLEMGPLSFFNFKNVLSVNYCGQEKLKEGKMFVIEGRPQLQESVLGGNDEEYRCKIWISAKDKRAYQVLFQPVETGSKNVPTITLKFWDYDQPAVIEPPAGA